MSMIQVFWMLTVQSPQLEQLRKLLRTLSFALRRAALEELEQMIGSTYLS